MDGVARIKHVFGVRVRHNLRRSDKTLTVKPNTAEEIEIKDLCLGAYGKADININGGKVTYNIDT